MLMNRVKGFTLIELLIVIVIIGIASSIIVLNASLNSSRQAKYFTNALYLIIKLARDEAIFTNNTIGLQMQSDKYLFMVLDDTKNEPGWRPLQEADSFWRTVDIPKSLVVTIDTPKNMSAFTSNASQPKVILYPSGEIIPFTITVREQGNATTYTINGSQNGLISVVSK